MAHNLRIFGIVDGYYAPVTDCVVDWPWAGDKHRKTELFTDDVLTKAEDGTYTKHTGICQTNLIISDDMVRWVDKAGYLVA